MTPCWAWARQAEAAREPASRPPRGDDARGEARPAHHDDGRSCAVTGPGRGAATTRPRSATGRVGSLLNLVGRASRMREAQRIAVEETRLGIPLLLRLRRGARPPHDLPDPARRGRRRSTRRLWERTAARGGRARRRPTASTLTFAPMLDVARDPRWGRIAEGPGEDPWLGVALRRGQGARLPGRRPRESANARRDRAKHSGAYGAVDGRARLRLGRRLRAHAARGLSAALPRPRSRRACAAIMPAFNDIAGVPMTAQRRSCATWLRGELGLRRRDRQRLQRHRRAHQPRRRRRPRRGRGAGAQGRRRHRHDGRRLREGPARSRSSAASSTMADDRRGGAARAARSRSASACSRPLPRGAAPGLRASRPPGAPRARARGGAPLDRAADEPRRRCCRLRTRPRGIAVIGPLADAASDMLGPWSAAGAARDMVTVLEGLRAAFPDEPASRTRRASRSTARTRAASRRRSTAAPRRRRRGAVPRRGAQA